LLGFQLLDADEVGILAGHPVEKAFLVCRTDAVQVRGDNSWHGLGKEKSAVPERTFIAGHSVACFPDIRRGRERTINIC